VTLGVHFLSVLSGAAFNFTTENHKGLHREITEAQPQHLHT
jgi:hypothetical protein